MREPLTRRELVERGAAAGALVALGSLRSVPTALGALSADPRIRELARLVRGPVVTPASPRYANLRRGYNAHFNGVHPLAIVQPLDEADVQAVVRWAVKRKVRIVARSGGHSYAGYSTTTGVVVDLSRMAHVGLASGRARVGAGARLGSVVAGLAAYGRAIPTGSCPSVGIAGLALGGGFGFASRAWGLTCDNLTAAHIVTADGKVIVADASHHSDLLWASRGGGGGNFGIATQLTFRTHPIPSAAAYFVDTFAWSDVEAVVDAFLGWAPSAPDGLGALCRLAAGAQPTVQVFGQHLGGQAALAPLLAALHARVTPTKSTTGTESWVDLARRWGGCHSPQLGACTTVAPQAFAAGSDYLAHRPSAAGRAAIRKAVEDRGAKPGALLIDAYGGAINRVAPAATAFMHRNQLASIQYFAAAGDWNAARAWVRAARHTLAPHVSGYAYQNYIDPDLATWKHAYYGANLARLEQVKRRYDPGNVFRFAQSIPRHA
jgi:FAD/FMN-containing dehydrogenase